MRINSFFAGGRVQKSFWMTIMAAAMLLPAMTMHASHFGTPDKEELAMTSLPEYPGAPAFVLEREEITRDDKFDKRFYVRIKILTEEGKKYANVELRTYSYNGGWFDLNSGNTFENITGRTIHADGKVIPFNGKPYSKEIERGNGKIKEDVFTLPDVEVGSVIEYAYTLTYSHFLQPPDWYIQSDLFVKTAHYAWYPTANDEHIMNSKGNAINSISWFPVLPPGVEVSHRNLLEKAPSGQPLQLYELTIKDVPPHIVEQFAPPTESFAYQVRFNYSEFHSPQEFWNSKGKAFSKQANAFIGPSPALTAETKALVSGIDAPEAQLRKIYETVESFENTNFTRAHQKEDDKETGTKISSTEDVYAAKRGSSEQLAELFVGMARAVGFKAYVMVVPDRSHRLLMTNWLNIQQFDNTIAIVNVDGKDQYFDPGSRYCPYGFLSWQNTFAMGLRQTDDGATFAKTPGEGYASNKTVRVAVLTIGDDNKVKGTINVAYTGDAALNWRQTALRGDSKSLLNTLRSSMERELPNGLELDVDQIENLTDYEQPFKVVYVVTGQLGTATGKRVVLPVDIFTAKEKPTFPSAKRNESVYFHFPEQVQDAVRINLPKTLAIEAGPQDTKIPFMDMGAYSLSVTTAPGNLTVRRSYAINTFLFSPKEYPALQSFYSQFQSKDQETIVLKTNAVGAEKGSQSGN